MLRHLKKFLTSWPNRSVVLISPGDHFLITIKFPITWVIFVGQQCWNCLQRWINMQLQVQQDIKTLHSHLNGARYWKLGHAGQKTFQNVIQNAIQGSVDTSPVPDIRGHPVKYRLLLKYEEYSLCSLLATSFNKGSYSLCFKEMLKLSLGQYLV